jgi:hypothetical protein
MPRRALLVAPLLLVLLAGRAGAQTLDPGALGHYYQQWIDMVHRTHEDEQPDWMTPLVTVIPTLQQEIRTDFSFSDAPHNLETYSYLTKGTEVIPTDRQELIFGNPTYVTRNPPRNAPSSGLADWSFLYKYRILAAPNDDGNYVLTFLFSSTYATGAKSVSASHDFFSPLLGFGKGWHDFDYQATIGPSIADGEISKLGTPVVWNSVFQYHLRFPTPFLSEDNRVSSLWPEFETAWSAYPNGEAPGMQQLSLTFGAIAGRFNVYGHAHFVLGMVYQFAVTHARANNHQFLVTMRIPFF